MARMRDDCQSLASSRTRACAGSVLGTCGSIQYAKGSNSDDGKSTQRSDNRNRQRV